MTSVSGEETLAFIPRSPNRVRARQGPRHSFSMAVPVRPPNRSIHLPDGKKENPMPGKLQFCNSLFHIILCTATVVLVIAITVSRLGRRTPSRLRRGRQQPRRPSLRLHASTPQASRQRRRSAPACSPQGQALYSNGPLDGTHDAWTINYGYVVSNSFTLGSASTVGGFDFYTWGYPATYRRPWTGPSPPTRSAAPSTEVERAPLTTRASRPTATAIRSTTTSLQV